MKLINPAVGDALSDMLYCMAALQVRNCLPQILFDFPCQFTVPSLLYLHCFT